MNQALYKFIMRIDPYVMPILDISLISIAVSRAAGVPTVPSLLLETTGRKSGRKIPTVVFYFRDGDNYLVVGSRGGSPKHPAWFLNLEAKPEASITVHRRKIQVRSRVASGEERARLWDIVTKPWPNYIKYQQAAGERQIPVVVLEPVAAK